MKNSDFPQELQVLLLEYLPLLHFPNLNSIAVRPSVIFGEIPTRMISNLHNSVINVDKYPNLLHALRFVWASNWSYQAYEFRRKNCIPHESMSVAVMLQKMAKIDFSGVCHTSLKGQADFVRIQAGWGVPSGIEEGRVPYDEILVKYSVLQGKGTKCDVIKEIVARKDKMQIFNGNEEVLVDTPPERVGENVLDIEEARLLGVISKRVEKAFNHPMKVIWGHDREILVLGVDYEDEQKIDTNRWIKQPGHLLNGPVFSPSGISLEAGFLEQDIRSLCEHLSRDVKFLHNNTTRTLLGRLYSNFDKILSLYESFNLPEKVMARAIMGYALFKDSDEVIKVVAGVRNNSIDSTRMKSWQLSIENITGENGVKINSFIKEMEGFPYKDAKLKSLCKTLTAMAGRMYEIQEHSFSLALTILSIGLVLILRSGKSYYELYNEIPDNVQTFEVAFLDEVMKLFHLGMKESEVREAMSGETFTPSDFRKLGGTQFFSSFLDFVKEFGYMALNPFDLSSPRLI